MQVDGRPQRGGQTHPNRRQASGRSWVLAACALLLAGAVVSAASALLWRSSVQRYQRQAFRTAATDISDTAQTLLRRDTDFTGTLDTVLSLEPHLGQVGLNRWYTALEGWKRQVGGLGLTVVSAVPAAQVDSFLARRNAEPQVRQLLGAIRPVVRDGRSRYCLVSTGESLLGTLGSRLARELQGDWCQPDSGIGATQAPRQKLATDTRALIAYPAFAEGLHTLVFEQAFYRPGADLSTIAQRGSAVAGWVVGTFDIATLLRAALDGRGKLGLSLYHANPGQAPELVGQAGATASSEYSAASVANVEGPWTLTVRGAVATGGLSATTQALIVFAVGLFITLLLAALLLVLGRSRERAMGAVKEKIGQLRHQALHDALTGLPNRTHALDRAGQMLARARGEGTPVAALHLGLDEFSHVNDAFGHAAGDELLRMVAERLTAVLRDSVMTARLGDHEFLVLAEGSAIEGGPEHLARRLLDVLAQPYEMNGSVGRELRLTVSVGIATGTNVDELLAGAAVALSQARAMGGNRYELFQPAMRSAHRDRQMLELDLMEALDRRELFLLYQPTFNLRTGEILGVEALLRWRHPTRGTVSPAEFIPIAETSGLITAIGRWVLVEACHQAARWHRRGHSLSVAVNVSGRQLDDDELLEDVGRALRESGLVPEALTLEVTETALMRDAGATAERLRSLKRLGVRIAIDDFGTGYSSLAYLRQFPADILKIDRAFVGGVAISRASLTLVHTLVELAKALNLETIAEGIEDRAQLKALRRQGCDHGQGFLLARPLDAAAVEEFLDAPSAPVQSPAASPGSHAGEMPHVLPSSPLVDA
jgi:diguanylate cyclase (GGDEF)-like protein